MRKRQFSCFLFFIVIWIVLIYTPDGLFCSEPKTATITFGGDMLLGGYYNSPRFGTMNRLRLKIDSLYKIGGADFVRDVLFRDLYCHFQESDFGVVNLEGPITPNIADDSLELKMLDKTIPVRQVEQTADLLKSFGIDLVSLANNHMFDYNRQEGLEMTISYLKGKIHYAGAGLGNKAFEPHVEVINGISIAFFAVSDIIDPPGICASKNYLGIAGIPDTSNYPASQNLNILLSRMRIALEVQDFVVVLLHAGPYSGSELDKRQIELIDLLLEGGCDVIIGSHSHYSQSKKVTQDKNDRIKQIAFYGLGNVIFGGRQGAQAESMLVKLSMNLNSLGNKYLTFETISFHPNPDTSFTPVVINDSDE
ncbi:CapA family protein [bacterium]|nr:CapA family protein [bacterium]